jgi:uncharacterized protein
VIVRRVALALIRFYQRYLSGLKRPTCRFVPTCSEYASEAITHYGVLRGSLKALWRLLRCQPLCAGGYDPVLPAAHVCGQLEAPEEAKP